MLVSAETAPAALLRLMTAASVSLLSPTRPPARTPLLLSSMAVTSTDACTLSITVLPATTPASAPAAWLPSTEPPLSVRFSMRAFCTDANRPVALLAGASTTKPAIVWPSPWNWPRKLLALLTLVVASLPIGLKPSTALALAFRLSASA